MSKAIEKMGGLSSRWSTALFECVTDAIDHNISPKEFVQEVQEYWDVALYDRKKWAAQDFNKLLETRVGG